MYRNILIALFTMLLVWTTGCEQKPKEAPKSESGQQKNNPEAAEAKAESNSEAPPAAGQAASPEEKAVKIALARQGEAKVGDHTLCPIMGDDFKITEKSPSVEHEGKKIYFCCAGCDSQFQEDPSAKLEAINKKIDAANAAL